MAFRRDNLDRESFLKILNKNCLDLDIITRPNAGNGLWLSALLPLAYATNTFNKKWTHFNYKLSTIICFCLLLQSIEIFVKLGCGRLSKSINYLTKLIPGGICAFLVWICLKQGLVFSLLSGYLPAFLYNGLYLIVLKKMPKSFTLGEASIVVQGYVIFLYNAYIQVPYNYFQPPTSNTLMMTAIVQVGLLGVTGIIALTFLFSFLQRSALFYFVVLTILMTVIVAPITQELPIIVLINFIFAHAERIFFTIYLLGLLGLTGATVWWQVNRGKSSTTAIRKIFHILTVLVYIPGLIYECTYLFVASTVIFSIFLVLEAARVVKLYPVAEHLQSSVQAFIDEKDAGNIALTPVYLLAGCSLPLWMHSCPCDVADSAGFNFLPLTAGILSVGIGDTAASFFGSKFGRHKWPGQNRSIEGTIANILSQSLAMFLFNMFGLIDLTTINVILSTLSITITSIIEAKTDQVDNLILPIISFILLSL